MCERGGRGREGCVRERLCIRIYFVPADNPKCFCDFCFLFGLSIFRDTSMNSE